ncbi:MAG: hypothetical protein RLZZ09_3236 [Pseudomonadota bacterium]
MPFKHVTTWLGGLLLLICLSGTPVWAACEFSTNRVAVDDGTIVYNRYGEGPAVLLLHGLFADKEQWHGLACALSATGYSAIAPDLPGYGQSVGFPLPDYRLEAQAKLLHQLMQRLGIGRYDVAGSSMGGTIAALYRRMYHREVRTLAFIGSPLGIIDWSPAVQAAITVGTNPFIPVNVAQFDLEMRLLFVTPPDIPLPIKQAAVDQYVTRNRHYQQVWDIVNLYDTVLTRGHWGGKPTLAIWGKDDQIYSVKGARLLKARIPRASVFKLANAGHLLMMENTAEVARLYVRFLLRR